MSLGDNYIVAILISPVFNYAIIYILYFIYITGNLFYMIYIRVSHIFIHIVKSIFSVASSVTILIFCGQVWINGLPRRFFNRVSARKDSEGSGGGVRGRRTGCRRAPTVKKGE